MTTDGIVVKAAVGTLSGTLLKETIIIDDYYGTETYEDDLKLNVGGRAAVLRATGLENEDGTYTGVIEK